MDASNAESLLKFTHQTTYTQQLQEIRRRVKPVKLSKWIILVRIAAQLTLYTGVVDWVITAFTLKRKSNSSYT
jgi:hypothetical protein